MIGEMTAELVEFVADEANRVDRRFRQRLAEQPRAAMLQLFVLGISVWTIVPGLMLHIFNTERGFLANFLTGAKAGLVAYFGIMALAVVVMIPITIYNEWPRLDQNRTKRLKRNTNIKHVGRPRLPIE
jgi:hypothetical protein